MYPRIDHLTAIAPFANTSRIATRQDPRRAPWGARIAGSCRRASSRGLRHPTRDRDLSAWSRWPQPQTRPARSGCRAPTTPRSPASQNPAGPADQFPTRGRRPSSTATSRQIRTARRRKAAHDLLARWPLPHPPRRASEAHDGHRDHDHDHPIPSFHVPVQSGPSGLDYCRSDCLSAAICFSTACLPCASTLARTVG